jgi:hypothetical protein
MEDLTQHMVTQRFEMYKLLGVGLHLLRHLSSLGMR